MPAPNYSLQIKFETPGLDDLENRIPAVLQKIRSEISAVNGEMKNFSSSMQGLSSSSGTLNARFDTLSKSAQTYGKSITDMTSQVAAAIQGNTSLQNSIGGIGRTFSQSSSGFREFSTAATSSMQEARYAAQLFGREVGVTIPRALSSIAAQTPGLQTALSMAFPVVGAIAFGEVIAQVIEKIVEWKAGLKDIQEFNETIGKTLDEQARKREQLNKETQESQLRLIGATRGPAAEEAARAGLLSGAVNTDKKNLDSLEAQLTKVQKRIADASAAIHGTTVINQTTGIRYSQTPSPLEASRRSAELKDAQGELAQITASLGVARAQYTRDNTTMAATRAQQLKDQQKEDAKAERPIDQYRAALSRMQTGDKYTDMGQIGAAMRERDDFVEHWRKISPNAQRDADAAYNERMGFGANGKVQPQAGIIAEIQRNSARSMNEEAKRNNEQLDRSGWSEGFGYAPMFGAQPIENLATNGYTDSGAATLLSDTLRRSIEQDRGWPETYRKMMEMGSIAQVGQASRQMGLNRSLRDIRGDASPNADYNEAIEAAKQEFDARIEGAKQLETLEERITETMKARYDYAKAEDQARIQREEAIAKIGQEQSQEAGRFFSGWTMAALSGKPSASTNYLRGFGEDIFSHIVSNTASAVLPTGLNQFTSLASSGILGTDPDHRSLIGKAVQGTPLDWNANELKKLSGDPNTALITSQGALKASIDANTVAHGGIPPSGSSSSGAGIPGIPANVGGGIASMTHAIQSGNPSSIISSAASMVSSFGGASVRGGAASIPDVAAMIGTGGTAGFAPGPTTVGGAPHPMLGGGSDLSAPDLGSFLSPVIPSSRSSGFTGTGGEGMPNLDSFYNNVISNDVAGFGSLHSGSVPNGTLSVSSSGGASPGLDLSSFYKDAVSVGGASGGLNANAPSFGSKIAAGANKLSGLVGTTGKMLASGDALGGVLTGKVDYGDGTAQVLKPSERVAGGIGLGAATYEGVSQAVKDFSKGGARGDIAGIGAAAGTAAAWDPDPLSRLALTGASTIMGLVSSLFPDPRAQRMKQESQTLVNDSYIRPSQRDYNFGGPEGSGGYSLGMGGSLRAGGPSANTTLNLNAHFLDAKDFVNYIKSNPMAAGSALMTGLTDSGISAISNEVNWNSTHSGYVPPGGLSGG